MDQAGATGRRVDIGPVGGSGYGGPQGASQSYSDGGIGGPLGFSAGVEETDGIEAHRSRPRTDGHIGQNNVQRLSEPGAVQKISELLRHRTSTGIQGFIERLLQGFVERL
jgi:hypothetical protein